MMQSNQAKIRVTADGERNAEQQTTALRNRENVQEVSKHKKSALKSKWPKSDARHWQGRIFRNSYTRDGERHETADWCVKLGHLGRRETFNLDTPNAEAAAVRALKIYRVVIGAGWDAALAEFKPDAKPPEPSAPDTASATIGQLIEAATRLSSARRESLDTYAKALRRIAVGVLEIDGTGKFNMKHGAAAWRASVDAVKLDRLTPAAVLAWKNAFLKSAANPQERNSAAVTVNSLLRNSKALLSKRVRPFLEKEIVLPSPLWFESVPMEKEPSMRYHSTIDAGIILRAAMDELAPAEPEAFKALILTLICGLRRSEADSMQWAQVDLNAGTLEMMPASMVEW